ncbi:MAG: hypothetical protein ABIJ12_07475, partial [bacterium]
MSFEYEYFTEFRFPFAISKGNDFKEKYEVDDGSYFIVQDGDNNDSKFSLYVTCAVDDPEKHDPTDFAKHATELQYFYNIMCTSVAFQTGFLVKSN